MEIIEKTNGLLGKLEPSATLAITSKAKAMKSEGLDICSMSAGEPDFDTPAHIKQAAIDALNNGETKYTPASGTPALKKSIVNKFITENNIKTTAEQIIVAPGAKFSIFTAIAALCGEGDEVILATPYWVSYPEIVKSTGAKMVIVETSIENNFEVSLEDLEAAVTENTKLFVLNSPSNPTGSVYRKETLQAIAKLAIKYNFMILSDEIYEKLVYDTKFPHISIASLSDEICDLTITVNGFSKAYAMTGWRLGYLTAPLWLVKRISALQSHTTSNPTTFAQAGALAALEGDLEPVEEMRKAFSKRRDLIYKLVNAIPGITAARPTGAFYIFCDISSFKLSSEEFCTKLLKEKLVAAIPGKPFGADKNIRMSYACSEEQIIEALKRLKDFCASI